MPRSVVHLAALLLLLAAATPSGGCTRRDDPPRTGPARRVVALAPNLAEIAADMGGAGRLVGISSYGEAPEGAEDVERVGGFVDPSIERIIALSPDLVVGVPYQRSALEACRSAGLATREVGCETLDQALAAYGVLGEALGLEAEAGAARCRLEARLDGVRARVAGRARPRTLFLLGRAGEDLQQVFPVSPGNFGDELLTIAGGRNVLSGPTPSVSAESVIALAPEVAIEVAMDAEEGAPLERLEPSPLWERLGSVPAVQSGRVHAVAATSLLVPGPRMGSGAELLAGILHPDPADAAP